MNFANKFSVCVMISILFLGCVNESRKKEIFARHLGTYILDTSRTELAEYTDDSNTYKNLTITFKSTINATRNLFKGYMTH